MKKNLIKYGIVGSLLAPVLALAQNNSAPGDISGLLGLISQFINIITIILVSVAVLMFIIGVIKYVSAGGDEEAQQKARGTMIYGIIGIFVIVAVWGLVNILGNTFIKDNTSKGVPCVPGTIKADGSLC